MKTPTVWNLQFHRTIQMRGGTQSQDLYTLRRDNVNLPYYTFSVPHGDKKLPHDLYESMNHRTVYEDPAPMPEIDAIFHGPWQKSISNIPCLIMLESEVRTLQRTYASFAAKNITLEHELKTLKTAYQNLDRMYNLQSKVIQRLRINEQPFEDEIAKPELPDLFKDARDFDRSVPQFEYGNPMARGPLASSKY